MAVENKTPRARMLTDEDIKVLALLLQEQHQCKFPNVTQDDMSFVRDLVAIYKETRSEVIKWIIRGVIYGSLMVVCLYAWAKYGGKH